MNHPRPVYICLPIGGDIEQNILNARKYCQALVKQGYTPLSPTLTIAGICENVQQEKQTRLEMLKLCYDLYIFSDVITEEMQAEIDLAKRMDIQVIKEF